MGKFHYEVEGGKITGFFNIYQARNGKIYLMMGNAATPLSSEQIDQLGIDLYQLNDFDIDSYRNAYRP